MSPLLERSLSAILALFDQVQTPKQGPQSTQRIVRDPILGTAPRSPKTAQDEPEMVPRRPREGPKQLHDSCEMAQDNPKTAVRRPKMPSDGHNSAQMGNIRQSLNLRLWCQDDKKCPGYLIRFQDGHLRA